MSYKSYNMVRDESLISTQNLPVTIRKRSSIDETMNHSRDTKESSGDQNYKTELCRTWVEKNFCPYREKCRFAHGKKDLHEKVINSKNYKMKECNSFYQKGYCPYGPRCHFKHEERKLDDVTRPYYPFLLISKNTIEKFDSSINNKINYPQFLYTLLDSGTNSRPLKVFEKLRGKNPPSHALQNMKLFNNDDVNYSRQFIFQRKIFDSCM